ncbi:endonuclease/exonuclease/phosphatase family protein [Alistipes senegalensis]|uniref:endonuclease/exonuclease/phosphatase family protein n=1 Tax=Alistipes senegalensis TaxID=1288121 RepID=UPI0018A9A511|nr:endonuclease/exonuclease/phosphatase family protein [Alistipes senegalensis]
MVFKILIFPLLALFLSSGCSSDDGRPADEGPQGGPGNNNPQPEYADVSVVSFNIRVDNSAQDGANRWSERRQAAVNMLQGEKPVVMGLQEAQAHQITFLARNCADYAWYGLGRDTGTPPPATDSYAREETMAIFWREADVELLDKGTFWLSETPGEVSKLPSADYRRTCTWGLFRLRETGAKFYLFNTHLATESGPRGEQIGILVANMKRINDKRLPAFLTGDFNADTDEAAFAPLLAYLSDARAAAPLTDGRATWNDYGQATGPRKYDHVFFLSGRCVARRFQVLTADYGASYISDHYPVKALFGLQK